MSEANSPSDRQQRYASPQFSFPRFVDKYTHVFPEQSLKIMADQSPQQSIRYQPQSPPCFSKGEYTLETRLVTDQKKRGLKKAEYKIKVEH